MDALRWFGSTSEWRIIITIFTRFPSNGKCIRSGILNISRIKILRFQIIISSDKLNFASNQMFWFSFRSSAARRMRWCICLHFTKPLTKNSINFSLMFCNRCAQRPHNSIAFHKHTTYGWSACIADSFHSSWRLKLLRQTKSWEIR